MQAYQTVMREHDIESRGLVFRRVGMDDHLCAGNSRAPEATYDEFSSQSRAAKTQLHREMIADELPLLPGIPTFSKPQPSLFAWPVSMANETG